MKTYLNAAKPQTQTEKSNEREVKNNAGGYVYSLDIWGILDRFFLLGTEGGTYYQGESDLTKQNFNVLKQCVTENPQRVINRILEFSSEGRAFKKDVLIFSIAYLTKNVKDPRIAAQAYSAAEKVCEIPTHLFKYLQAIGVFGGYSSGVKNMLKKWYLNRQASRLAYQVAKYREREGWTHNDALRLAHIPFSAERVLHNEIFSWITWKEGKTDKNGVAISRPAFLTADTYPEELKPIVGYEKAKACTNIKELIPLIKEFRLPMEFIPKQFLGEASVWEAMLPNMPIANLIRNLGNLSKHKLLTPLGANQKLVVEKLTNPDLVAKSKLHPIAVAIAIKVYAQGHSIKGDGTWEPNQKVIEALSKTFELAFKNVEPTGKNFVIGLDISGSMSSLASMNIPMTCRELSSTFAWLINKTEPNCLIGAFNNGFKPLVPAQYNDINTLMNVVWEGGSTDCAQPIIYATEKSVDTDAFVIITDNETWAGSVKVDDALAQYNKKMKKNAKLIVMGMTTTAFTIGDPNNPNVLNIAGCDAGFPQLISEFVKL